jgi:hypothetical protein
LQQRTLIVAQDHEGHVPVIALTSHGVNSNEFKINMADLHSHCETTRIARSPITPRSIARLALSVDCRRAFLPDGDRFAIRLGLTRARQDLDIVALVMQDPHWCLPSSAVHRVKLGIKTLALRMAETLPRTRILYLADHSQPPSRPTQNVAPDPVLFDASEIDADRIRDQLGLEPTKFWFVVAGKITPRKNLTLISTALLSLNRTDVGLFVCGAIDPPVKAEVSPIFQRLRQHGTTVVTDDRIQSDHEINRAIQASDCVVVAYSTDQPTSMMAKAARAGRRIVVAGGPSLRHWASNLGITLTGPLETPEVARLLHEATQLPEPEPRTDLGHDQFINAFL